MPRNGSGVYSKPSGSTVVPQTTIESTVFNAVVDDFVQDLNAVRPISSGGTGASSASGARASLGVPSIAEAEMAAFIFDDAAAVFADATRTYANTSVGKYIRTRRESYVWQVAASGATDHHVTTAGGLKLYVVADRASPKQFGNVGSGTDDQAILAKWLSYAVAGKPAVLDCRLRQSAAVAVLTATGRVDITSTPDGRIDYVGIGWVYRMIEIKLAGYDCFVNIPMVDGGDNAGKGVHLSNDFGSPQTNTVRLSCGGQNFRIFIVNALDLGYQLGVMSFSGGCEHLIVEKWHGRNVTGVAGNNDSLQMFVIAANDATGVYPKHIHIKEAACHNIKFDDYTTRATSNADGLVIFGLKNQTEGSCVIDRAITSEICGRGMKLPHKLAVVKYQKDYRSIQGHTVTANTGATGCAFQYGTGIHENFEGVYEGPDVFKRDCDTLVSFSTQSDILPDVRARREVKSISVTCNNTGTTYGLGTLVDFRCGFDMVGDKQYTSILQSATMAGGFCNYAIGVRSSGNTAGRPHTVFVSNVEANIKTAFAEADATMGAGAFVMRLTNILNTKGSDIPVIARGDAVDMNGAIGEITGSGIKGLARSRGIAWAGVPAGYAPVGSKYRSPSANRSTFSGTSGVPLFDQTLISSASGTLSSPCKFPCIIRVETVFSNACGTFFVSNTGVVTTIINTNATHLQANGLSAPGSGTYKLWTTLDYSGTGGTVYFNTTDGTARYFEVIADL